MRRTYTFYRYIAFFFIFNFNVQAQNHLIDDMSKVYEMADSDTSKIKALNDLAFEYIHVNPQIAQDDVAIALESAQAVKFKKGTAQSYNVIGSIAWTKSDYPEALNGFFKSLDLYKELQDPQGISICYNNIGEVYKKLKEFDQSLNFLQRAKALKEISGDKSNANLIAVNIGEIYSKLQKYDSATIYFNQGLKDGETYERASAYAYNGLAGIQYDKKNYDSAIFYHTKALNIRQEILDNRGIASSYLNLANCYTKTSEIPLAEDCFTQALASSYKSGARDIRMKIYEKRSGMYERTENIRGAFSEYKKYSNLKDSVFNEEKAEQIIRLQTSYETELLKKEREASLVAIKQRNTVIIIVIILFILMATLAYAFYRQRKTQIKVNHLLADKNDEIQLQSEEIHTQSEKLIALNKNLENLNGGLEDKIRERTKLLKEQNKLLAEYAYISAHEVRAPVASVLGLINLLKYTSFAQQEKQILQFLEKSTNELDEVIRSIRTKLDDKSNELIED